MGGADGGDAVAGDEHGAVGMEGAVSDVDNGDAADCEGGRLRGCACNEKRAEDIKWLFMLGSDLTRLVRDLLNGTYLRMAPVSSPTLPLH